MQAHVTAETTWSPPWTLEWKAHLPEDSSTGMYCHSIQELMSSFEYLNVYVLPSNYISSHGFFIWISKCICSSFRLYIIAIFVWISDCICSSFKLYNITWCHLQIYLMVFSFECLITSSFEYLIMLPWHCIWSHGVVACGLWQLWSCFSLQAMKAKVWKARSSSPLFNTKIYASNLERLFDRMWKRYEQGLQPEHLVHAWDMPNGSAWVCHACL